MWREKGYGALSLINLRINESELTEVVVFALPRSMPMKRVTGLTSITQDGSCALANPTRLTTTYSSSRPFRLRITLRCCVVQEP